MKNIKKLQESLNELEATVEMAKYYVPMEIDVNYAKNKAKELEEIAGNLFLEFPENDKITKAFLSTLEHTINYLKQYNKYELLSFLVILIKNLNSHLK